MGPDLFFQDAMKQDLAEDVVQHLYGPAFGHALLPVESREFVVCWSI